LLIGDAAIDDLVGLDVVLSLIDKGGNPNASRLSIRITQDSMSVIAGCAMEQAQAKTESLTQPFVANAANTLTAVPDAVSNQQNLITMFDALTIKFGALLKLGDEVAKVWSAVSFRLWHNSK
jgi:hypothetical protein